MSSLDLKRALALVASHPELADFVGPRSGKLLSLVESALGREFPPLLREFISRLGAGSFGAFEVYGVIDERFSRSSVPDGVWLTLEQRLSVQLSRDLFIVSETGLGGWYCTELGARDAPVIICGESGPRTFQTVAADFGEFFLRGILEQIPLPRSPS
jgi:antitoxin YobK